MDAQQRELMRRLDALEEQRRAAGAAARDAEDSAQVKAMKEQQARSDRQIAELKETLVKIQVEGAGKGGGGGGDGDGKGGDGGKGKGKGKGKKKEPATTRGRRTRRTIRPSLRAILGATLRATFGATLRAAFGAALRAAIRRQRRRRRRRAAAPSGAAPIKAVQVRAVGRGGQVRLGPRALRGHARQPLALLGGRPAQRGPRPLHRQVVVIKQARHRAYTVNTLHIAMFHM